MGLIAEVRNILTCQKVSFQEKRKTFGVTLGDGKVAAYTPEFIGDIQGNMVVIEPVASYSPKGEVQRIIAFRHQYGRRYKVVIVTRNTLKSVIPSKAYDQILSMKEFSDFSLDEMKSLWKTSFNE